jgi:hypothetical protein
MQEQRAHPLFKSAGDAFLVPAATISFGKS